MTIETVHEEFIRANLLETLTPEDTLLWMVLVHTHEIRFREPLLEDRPGIMGVSAVTQRHAADIAAALWRHRKRQDLASSTHWYHEYLVHPAGCECIEDLPVVYLPRFCELRDQLLTDPRVAAVVPED